MASTAARISEPWHRAAMGFLRSTKCLTIFWSLESLRRYSGALPPLRIRPSYFSGWTSARSEEHTSELQSLAYLVCRLLLEKKKKNRKASRVSSHYTKHTSELYSSTHCVRL